MDLLRLSVDLALHGSQLLCILRGKLTELGFHTLMLGHELLDLGFQRSNTLWSVILLHWLHSRDLGKHRRLDPLFKLRQTLIFRMGIMACRLVGPPWIVLCPWVSIRNWFCTRLIPAQVQSTDITNGGFSTS